jgi:hypothetical protein
MLTHSRTRHTLRQVYFDDPIHKVQHAYRYVQAGMCGRRQRTRLLPVPAPSDTVSLMLTHSGTAPFNLPSSPPRTCLLSPPPPLSAVPCPLLPPLSPVSCPLHPPSHLSPVPSPLSPLPLPFDSPPPLLLFSLLCPTLNLLPHSPLAAHSLTWSNENEEYVHTVCTKADARANWWW